MKDFDRRYVGPVVGMDEVATSAIAGPLILGAGLSPRSEHARDVLVRSGLKDAKLMGPAERARLLDLAWRYVETKVYVVPVVRLDRWGLPRSLRVGYLQLWRLCQEWLPGTILVDGPERHSLGFEHRGVVRGDGKSIGVALGALAASVAHDRWVERMHQLHPRWNWLKHGGYGTREHLELVERYGRLAEHRLSPSGR